MKYLFLSVMSIFTLVLNAQNVIIEKDYVEATFTKKTTKQDLEQIQKKIAEEGIHVDYEKLVFNKKGKLRAISFKVDCNNGNSGSALSENLGLEPIGFFCNKRPGAKTSFFIGGMKSVKKRS